MMGAGLNMRVGPICRTVQDAAKVLDVIAGYDPKDELTVFSVGRMPSQPYASFRRRQDRKSLDGVRIGVIREYMNKKLFSKADEESIDIVERAVGDLRRLGATVVDPGPEGALFQSCVVRYAPQLSTRVRASAESVSARSRRSDRDAAAWRRPVRVPTACRSEFRRFAQGEGKYMIEQVPARARRREHQDAMPI